MATNDVLVADIVDAYGAATPSGWYDTNLWWCTINPRDEFQDALGAIDADYATLWNDLDDDNGIHR